MDTSEPQGEIADEKQNGGKTELYNIKLVRDQKELRLLWLFWKSIRPYTEGMSSRYLVYTGACSAYM